MAEVEKASVVTSEMATTMHETCERKQRRSERANAISELGSLWDEGLASGLAVDGEEAFVRVRQKLATHAAR